MLSILRKARLKDKEMRVLMLGLDNAGKTTIVKQIMKEDVTTVSPTLGFIIKTIDFQGYRLNIWDVGGQKTLRSYWKNYFEKTDTLIWVVDATDRLRVEDCRDELAGLLLEERLTGASLLIFLNKTDVEGCMTEHEVREVAMSSTSGAEGSEDVNDFLLRIRELGERRDKEDEERTKKLEEEILKGRRERQARRAGIVASLVFSFSPVAAVMTCLNGQLSISPTKDSPPLFDTARLSMPPPTTPRAIDPPEQLEPTRLEPTPYDPERESTPKSDFIRDDVSLTTDGSRRGSRAEGSEIDTSPKPPSTSTSPLRSRTGTLSWQQRPSSRDLGGSRSFFSSSPTRENRWRAMSTTSNDDHAAPRSPSALSPSAKEPLPLNPTERSLGSPIRSKPAEEDIPETTPEKSINNEPALEVEGTPEPEKEATHQDLPEAARSRSPSRASSIFADSSISNRYSSVSSVSTATGLGSPIPLSSAQKLEPTKTEPSPEEQTSPISPRRLSPERSRSSSPTKGLGGFVQSAMMKRSDSVSKRWSAQLPSGLARGNSFASNRNSFAAPSNTDTFPAASRLSRDGPMLHPRPGSSHSEATVVSNKDGERPATPPVPGGNLNTQLEDSPSRPPLALNTKSSSGVAGERPSTPPVSGGSIARFHDSPGRPPLSLQARSSSAIGTDQGSETGSLPPTSPAVSRTMDPRRWSPTKSTWLESALNRPDSPRHKKQPSQSTPPWVRDRQSKGSIDLGRKNSFKEVTPVGLMRTAVPGSHSKTSSVSGIPDLLGVQETLKAKEEPVHKAVEEPENKVNEEIEKKDREEENTVKEEPEIEAKEESESLSKAEPNIPLKEAPESPVKEEPDNKVEEEPEAHVAEESEDIKAEDNKEWIPQQSSEPAVEVTADKSAKAAIEPQNTGNDAPGRKRAPSLHIAQKSSVDLPLSSPRDPLLNRPKPQSPVIDFRANLRRREVVKDESRREEPEFKNIFGKLKKTETSSYVAPDELKGNILKGKAALNATGGPKKSQRTDELKESILKQKEAMKASGGSVRRNTAGEMDAPPTLVPEAIARRNTLSKPSNDLSPMSPNTPTSPSPMDFGTPRVSQDTQPLILSPQEPKDFGMSTTQPEASEEQKPDALDVHEAQAEPAKLDTVDDEKNDRSTPLDLAEQNDAPVPENKQEESGEEAIKPVRALPSSTDAQATTAPAATEGPAAKGKLAGRINPALAGLLSRGSPIAANGTDRTLPSTSFKNTDAEASKSPAPLTHATKNRARGPKRRLPNAAPPQVPEPSLEDKEEPQEIPSLFVDSKEPEVKTPPEHAVGGSNWPLPDIDFGSQNSPETSLAQLAPSATNKPTEFRRTIPRMSSVDIKQKSEGLSPTPSPGLNNRFSDHERTSSEDAEALNDSPSRRPVPPSKASNPSTPVVGQARTSQIQYSSPSPSPLRTSFKENQFHPPPSYRKTPGVGPPWSNDSSPRDKALPSPPVPPKFNAPADQLSSPRSSASLVPQADESLEAISGFFKTFPSSSNRVDIDPQLTLENKSDNLKIRTLKKQMWEITGDGKRQDLPVNQEYILYEGSMYLCVHMFEAEGSIRSEVHLWCGDDVTDTSVDDAQSFSRRVAKENGAKLEVIKQGKETARFIQALGGILITRRGSSSRSSSSAIFMLCGRKHLGQMVFDEVNLSPRNLCTGYPFVISAMFGKLYLWKGKGSSAEEIGAARLIGMDLGLTGEFEEVTEGEEPESFFEVFPPYAETGDYMDEDFWRLKPNHDCFRLRLLRIDHELGQRSGFWLRRSGSASPVIRPNDTVQEVEPFCQKDLAGKGIYVLDIFFEIYVIVGDHSSNRPGEFASAVVFAHEYGILAASLQDRPFIPKSYVALGGTPDSCRSAFRKWVPRSPSTPPPRVFPLNAAIEAIRS
ncbi:putative gelsolin repeat protein [Aspergillus affinis]|uniref:putative gelsolin repeat protein n=1 Tax=Aspergillus affinis TaxID=1070780 RepID=UPI0022FE1751|nr:uncharacterized protein KD926_004792 [Aspergillus affinis]KAI9043001.1 hypothetical protein KD926_004792 [Aspergillus affinis]